MSFEKEKKDIHRFERCPFSIDDKADLFVVENFEKELKKYCDRSLNVFGKTITGFDLYLHENGLLRYTAKYQNGAVANLEGFEMAKLKYQALRKLWDRRAAGKNYDEERIQSLLPQMA